MEPTVLNRLVDILKKSDLDLQRKTASILEFIAASEPCVEQIISADIESGLEAVFQQKPLTGERVTFKIINFSLVREVTCVWTQEVT